MRNTKILAITAVMFMVFAGSACIIGLNVNGDSNNNATGAEVEFIGIDENTNDQYYWDNTVKYTKSTHTLTFEKDYEVVCKGDYAIHVTLNKTGFINFQINANYKISMTEAEISISLGQGEVLSIYGPGSLTIDMYGVKNGKAFNSSNSINIYDCGIEIVRHGGGNFTGFQAEVKGCKLRIINSSVSIKTIDGNVDSPAGIIGFDVEIRNSTLSIDFRDNINSSVPVGIDATNNTENYNIDVSGSAISMYFGDNKNAKSIVAGESASFVQCSLDIINGNTTNEYDCLSSESMKIDNSIVKIKSGNAKSSITIHCSSAKIIDSTVKVENGNVDEYYGITNDGGDKEVSIIGTHLEMRSSNCVEGYGFMIGNTDIRYSTVAIDITSSTSGECYGLCSMYANITYSKVTIASTGNESYGFSYVLTLNDFNSDISVVSGTACCNNNTAFISTSTNITGDGKKITDLTELPKCKSIHIVNEFSITFNLGGGEGTPVDTIKAITGSEIVLPGCDAKLGTKTFAGWTDGLNLYKAGDKYTVVIGATLTAVYEEPVPEPTPGGDSGINPTTVAIASVLGIAIVGIAGVALYRGRF